MHVVTSGNDEIQKILLIVIRREDNVVVSVLVNGNADCHGRVSDPGWVTRVSPLVADSRDTGTVRANHVLSQHDRLGRREPKVSMVPRGLKLPPFPGVQG